MLDKTAIDWSYQGPRWIYRINYIWQMIVPFLEVRSWASVTWARWWYQLAPVNNITPVTCRQLNMLSSDCDPEKIQRTTLFYWHLMVTSIKLSDLQLALTLTLTLRGLAFSPQLNNIVTCAILYLSWKLRLNWEKIIARTDLAGC